MEPQDAPHDDLHRIRHRAEIPTRFAVPEDLHGLSRDQCGDPSRDDGCVGSMRILARTEDVEVSQPDGLHPVAAGEDLGIKFIHRLGGGIRRDRPIAARPLGKGRL